MRINEKLAATGLAALLAAGLSGCSGDAGQSGPTQRELTAAERLSAAKKTLDAAPSVHLGLTSEGVPQNASGVVSADGSRGSRPTPRSPP
jgi:lipoprotein LprG